MAQTILDHCGSGCFGTSFCPLRERYSALQQMVGDGLLLESHILQAHAGSHIKWPLMITEHTDLPGQVSPTAFEDFGHIGVSRPGCLETYHPQTQNEGTKVITLRAVN